MLNFIKACTLAKVTLYVMISIGEELERENSLLENSQLSPAINLMETQQPIPDDIVRNNEEDLQLLARARAVGVQYEFAQHGASETEEDRRRRRRRNQRRVSHEEGRLREVVGDLPPPPLAGSSQVEDNAYSAIRAFEVEQMTYTQLLRGLQGKTPGMQGHKKHVYSLQTR